MKEEIFIFFFPICSTSFSSFWCEIHCSIVFSIFAPPLIRLLFILAIELPNMLEGSPSFTSLLGTDPPQLQIQLFLSPLCPVVAPFWVSSPSQALKWVGGQDHQRWAAVAAELQPASASEVQILLPEPLSGPLGFLLSLGSRYSLQVFHWDPAVVSGSCSGESRAGWSWKLPCIRRLDGLEATEGKRGGWERSSCAGDTQGPW